MLKKITLAGVTLLLAAFFVMGTPAHATALTETQVQAIVGLLSSFGADQSIINSVSAALAGTPTYSDSDIPVGSTSPSLCPRLAVPLQRGSRDAATGGQVSELQIFLADYYNLNEDDIVTGYFGKTTEQYVIKFQKEQGLPSFGIAGSLTRAKIAQVCGGTTPVSVSFTASPTSGPAPLDVQFSTNQKYGTVYFDTNNFIASCFANQGCDQSTGPSGWTYTSPGVYHPLLKDVLGNIVGTATITVTNGSCSYSTDKGPSSDHCPTGITVTAPNGGEQWEIGQLNTITWAPYGYNPEVNPAKDVNVFLERLDGSTAGQIMDTGKASLHTYFNIATYDNWAEPGQYRVYVGNRMTGAVDRSDAPFTLLPKSVDVKINGSDGGGIVTDNQPLTISWTTANHTFTKCVLNGVRQSPGSDPYGEIPVSTTGGSGTYYATSPSLTLPNVYSTVALYCSTSGGQVKTDSASTQSGSHTTPASIRVTSPNGGEQLNIDQPYTIKSKQSGLSKISLALYKNDQWLKWIGEAAGFSGTEGEVNGMRQWDFNPSVTFGSEASTLVGAGKVYKIYITGQKADGTGYVDDKSDAPFSFVVSTPTPTPSTNSTNFIISSDTQNINLHALAGSPATAGNYTFTINSGITVGSGSTANAAISTGVWPAGSTVTLINNGKIYGRGGNGGAGGSCTGSRVVVAPPPKCTAASAGGDGGSALSVNYNITLNNTNGSIFGGGGGGGGAGGITQSLFSGNTPSGGGGGGGGQGVAASNGGAGGTAMYPGSAGHSGTATSPGVPGKNNQYGETTIYKGGSGGTWASAGGKGEYSGATGGAAGKAILLNATTIVWQGGNNSAHVKGAVQ